MTAINSTDFILLSGYLTAIAITDENYPKWTV